MDHHKKDEPEEKNEMYKDLSIEKIFLREMKQFPLLTAEGEEELSRLILEENDKDALSRMVECNLRLARAVARRYLSSGVPYLDLIQAASLGLMAAAKRFDYRRKKKFSTYAFYWMRQAIELECHNYSSIVTCPPEVSIARRRIIRIIAQHKLKKGIGPSIEEISEIVALPSKKVEELLEYGRCYELRFEDYSDSIDREGREDDLHEMIGDMTAPTPEQILIAKQELKEISYNFKIMFSALARGYFKKTMRDKEIFLIRYGLNDGLRVTTLEAIAKRHKISRERARQIIDKGWKIVQKRCFRELIAKKWTPDQIKGLNEDWMKEELKKVDIYIKLSGLTADLFTQGLRE